MERIHRFRIRVEAQFALCSCHQRCEAHAGDARSGRSSEQIEDRRHDVHRSDRIGNPAMRRLAERRADDERHAGDGVVDEEAVRSFSVLPKALAVIAHHHDDGSVVQVVRLQGRDEPCDLTVCERDLSVVGVFLVSRRERFWRPVGRVRVVQVNPREEWSICRVFNPGKRLVQHFVGRPLDRRERQGAHLAEVEVVVVGVEPLVDAPFRREDVGGHEATGPVAPGLEQFGERGLFLAEEEPAVVADPVFGRKLSGEDAGVRRKRQRRRRDRLLEEHTFVCQSIDRWRLDLARSVCANPIRPGCIERDDDKVQAVPRHTARQSSDIHPGRGTELAGSQKPGRRGNRNGRQEDQYPEGASHREKDGGVM